ncbi:mannose-1-phosphate guanyltransferase [Mixta theicola]|uniref:Mannose-1-phosphate guanyltransferase n=1 Tax=Mixta theicola TaxID=1458355 RepID=A0A2K1QA65_9GAMM|nr:ABC transporter permease [Mixta theicola]PNS11924.1 mannose-1-phosphate guanyltransferase [Mixta theicola]GLR07855.1 mannose-1-phosphate guanyltransferase [Mixta theicola]
MRSFSLLRWWGVVIKELEELKKDPLSICLIVFIPLMQVIIFGYALNPDPKRLPMAVVDYDKSSYSRNVINALVHTHYFELIDEMDESQAREALQKGDVQFVVSIPAGFARHIIREERADLLIQADATNPAIIANALAATQPLPEQILRQSMPQAALYDVGNNNPINIIIQRVYNPESNMEYNIISGLFSLVITLTLVLLAGLSLVREKENGTIETLLATPVTAVEVISGKLTPYFIITSVQSVVIMLISLHIFHVPMHGDYISLILSILLFICSSLMVGIALSIFATNQLQSMQLTFFYLLPTILISGFMFPFQGMPTWAKMMGSLLPNTFFLRLIRGIMLKGNTIITLWQNALYLVIIIITLCVAVRFFYKNRLG